VRWELLGQPGEAPRAYALTADQAVDLFGKAQASCVEAGLPLHLEEVVLIPSNDLITLVQKSLELAAAQAGEGD
jgi:CRISPR-associated protein Csb1